ncbi:hypothetical protein J5N97_004860 [Dioscorea zingiberensis]|uniref:Uncharacterized protein n=1 Tax=Dioscorea zingiberensis TaxID=325984 RepID=A0A9D5D817_9LILI|nr:hypothetical protein J5N97_004860 [Dioscorea zingiberensis]
MKRDRGSRCLCALTPSGSFPRNRVIVSRGVGRLPAAATAVRERGELCADLRRILLISLQVGARDLAMGTWKNDHFFPLTSLQIGDLQSYLSRLTLFLAPESNKLFILVDNRPWLTDLDTRPAHLWQLMVTKSRLSPFANTRGGRKSKDFGRRFNLGNSSSEIKDTGQKLDFRNGSRSTLKGRRLYRWFSLIDAALYQEKAMLPVRKLKNSFLLNKELHHTLYGFIVFEVAWAHVRGINYLNELQTDTSMALETKLMKRWEFDSVEQAACHISSWFSGTHFEHFLLRSFLDSISVVSDIFYDASEDIPDSTSKSSVEHINIGDEVPIENFHLEGSGEPEHTPSSPYTPPPATGPYKRRKIIKSASMGSDLDEVCEEAFSEIVSSPRRSISSSSSFSSESENEPLIFGSTNHKDVLILFRFNDHDLPFRLKDIIMSDLRLLTLLEYGLPSWVIFLQSYPVFCKIYRPWMCPLARALYVLISIVTVLIGFYDLYKNVPLLKSTVARLFGPFFEWIENWEMISRIRYLGTMLFLHNFEKAVKWFLMITRACKSLLSVLSKPFIGPVMELVDFILPFWNVCLETVESLSSLLFILFGSTCSMALGIVQVILWPFWFIFTVIWSIATSVIYPVIWVFWEILVAPFRLVLSIANVITMIFSHTYYFLRETWSSIGFMFQFGTASEAALGAYEPSMWRSLWNDLFSQVFRAVRSILYGFVAFFTTCNRHRLSIYNHIQEFLLHLSHASRRSSSAKFTDGCQIRPKNPLGERQKHSTKCALQSQDRLHRRSRKKDKGGRTEEDYKLKSP